MGAFSIWHLLIVLLVIVLIFGTKKIRNIGPDLGSAIREFKKALGGDDNKPAGSDADASADADADADANVNAKSGATLNAEPVDPEATAKHCSEARDRAE